MHCQYLMDEWKGGGGLPLKATVKASVLRAGPQMCNLRFCLPLSEVGTGTTINFFDRRVAGSKPH